MAQILHALLLVAGVSETKLMPAGQSYEQRLRGEVKTCARCAFTFSLEGPCVCSRWWTDPRDDFVQVEMLAEQRVTEAQFLELAELAQQILLYITTKMLGYQERVYERY